MLSLCLKGLRGNWNPLLVASRGCSGNFWSCPGDVLKQRKTHRVGCRPPHFLEHCLGATRSCIYEPEVASSHFREEFLGDMKASECASPPWPMKVDQPQEWFRILQIEPVSFLGLIHSAPVLPHVLHNLTCSGGHPWSIFAWTRVLTACGSSKAMHSSCVTFAITSKYIMPVQNVSWRHNTPIELGHSPFLAMLNMPATFSLENIKQIERKGILSSYKD